LRRALPLAALGTRDRAPPSGDEFTEGWEVLDTDASMLPEEMANKEEEQ
jgi:hypothetical protein